MDHENKCLQLECMDLSYSKFIASLKDNKIEINRKSLAHMAVHEPDAFSDLIKNIFKSKRVNS